MLVQHVHDGFFHVHPASAGGAGGYYRLFFSAILFSAILFSAILFSSVSGRGLGRLRHLERAEVGVQDADAGRGGGVRYRAPVGVEEGKVAGAYLVRLFHFGGPGAGAAGLRVVVFAEVGVVGVVAVGVAAGAAGVAVRLGGAGGEAHRQQRDHEGDRSERRPVQNGLGWFPNDCIQHGFVFSPDFSLVIDLMQRLAWGLDAASDCPGSIAFVSARCLTPRVAACPNLLY